MKKLILLFTISSCCFFGADAAWAWIMLWHF